MEEIKEARRMLDLITSPCFCVKDNRIILTNREADHLMIPEGAELLPMLATGAEEYRAFTDGCLYLHLDIGGVITGASAVRMEAYDVFMIDQISESSELQALALAAQHLREPLSSAMMNCDQLSTNAALGSDPQIRDQLNRLAKGLVQLHRIIGNMSDAYHMVSRKECQNVTQVFQEIVEKAQTMVADMGVQLIYDGPKEQIYCLIDAQELERALLNLLSNALRCTSDRGIIRISLTRRERKLYLQISDNGSGISEEIISSVFRRFLRVPSLESSHDGIGLGLVLVRSAALHHDGTVLIDQPEGMGTRVTMTLTIQQPEYGLLRSTVLRVDYAGGRDHTLVELSDVLPPEKFSNI